jgi:hypothetical protein
LQADQLLRESLYSIDVIAEPTRVHPHVAAIGQTQARKRLCEGRVGKLQQGIVFVAPNEHADAPHALPRLLRAHRDRPSGSRTAE